MVVRQSQLEKLEVGHYVEFENRTAAWLQEHFPENCAWLGENGVRNQIRRLLQIAAGYGFHSQRDAAKYIFLAFLLGPGFDLDPAYAWLRAILTDPAPEPSQRIDRAYDEVARFYENLPEEP